MATEPELIYWEDDSAGDLFESLVDEPDLFEVTDAPPGAGIATGGTDGQYLRKSGQYDYQTEWVSPSVTPVVFAMTGDLQELVGSSRVYVEQSSIIARVRASVGTPSSGAPVLVDVLRNGVSVLNAPLAIPAGEYTATITSSIALTAGDYLTVHIVSVGTIDPGTDLTVSVTIE